MTNEATFVIYDCLPVEFFLDEAEQDRNIAGENAFLDASEATNIAADWFLDEYESLAGVRPSAITVEFVEFDSHNISHANAHYTVTVTTTQHAANRIKDEYGVEDE